MSNLNWNTPTCGWSIVAVYEVIPVVSRRSIVRGALAVLVTEVGDAVGGWLTLECRVASVVSVVEERFPAAVHAQGDDRPSVRCGVRPGDDEGRLERSAMPSLPCSR
jgi:hypothetical protein